MDTKLKAPRPKTNLFLKLSILLFLKLGCTFGSVGNKLEEDQLILESILKILRESPGKLVPVIHSYDDQLDTNLSQFHITSGTGINARTYQVQIMHPGSFLRVQDFQFRINPSDKPVLGIFKSNLSYEKTHTPYTIPLELPPDNPYGKVYIVVGGKVQNFMEANSEGIGLGSVSRTVFSETKVPRGIIASTQITIPRWDIRAQIIQTNPPASFPSNTRNLALSFRDLVIPFLPRCRLEIQTSQTTGWILGIHYGRLFRDYFSQNMQHEILNELFQATSSNPTEIITVTDLSPFYTLFEKNLKEEDTVFLQESCLL